MEYDVIVVGGGQSGLALGYYLRRTQLNFLILDDGPTPGGSWPNYWRSLRLFSPAQWSSLPGMIMPGGVDYYPTRQEAVEYLKNYELKYKLPIERPVGVLQVVKNGDSFRIETNTSTYSAKAVVAATGTFAHPIIPPIAGLARFKGTVLHSAQYKGPEKFSGLRVAIVGEGNSGAQILAEVSLVADTFWLTRKDPRFLPDHVDGRYLFDAATQMYEAKKQDKEFQPPSLGDVVMVPSVVNARERGVLKSVGSLASIKEQSIILANGKEIEVDAIIFCTGFQPALSYLANLGIVQNDGKVKTMETKAVEVTGLWLVGFGNWTGFAAATLIGVGRSAKSTVEAIELYLNKA